MTSQSQASLIPEDYIRAAERCLRHNIPFALYSFPGETTFRFYATSPERLAGKDMEGSGLEPSLVAHMWEGDEKGDESNIVFSDLSAADILRAPRLPRLDPSDCLPIYPSTPALYYIAQVGDIVDSLQRTRKVVLSRVIDGVAETGSLERFLGDFFGDDSQKHTLRYLYSTPATGIWVGATPEVIASTTLEQSRSTRDGEPVWECTAMALAGTRPAGSETAWNASTLIEHQVTASFIEHVLKDVGAHDITAADSILSAGAVEHLLRSYTATIDGGVKVRDFFHLLQPTPAVCGYPRDFAREQIASHETHRRLCYAAPVSIRRGLSVLHFANLRCAHLGASADPYSFRGFRYNIFTGGGLTRLSKAADEWEETSRKAAPLLAALRGIPAESLHIPDLYTQLKSDRASRYESKEQ